MHKSVLAAALLAPTVLLVSVAPAAAQLVEGEGEFTITVVENAAPAFDFAPRATLSLGAALAPLLAATDPDSGQTLRWSVVQAPLRGSLGGFEVMPSAVAGASATPSGVTYLALAGAPAAPTIESDGGAMSTSDATPVVSGGAEAGALVQFFADGDLVGTGRANDDGDWRIELDALALGSHVLTAVASSGFGSVSPASPPVTLSVAAAGFDEIATVANAAFVDVIGQGEYVFVAERRTSTAGGVRAYRFDGATLTLVGSYGIERLDRIWADGGQVYAVAHLGNVTRLNFNGASLTLNPIGIAVADPNAIWGDASHVYVADSDALVVTTRTGIFKARVTPRSGTKISDVWSDGAYIFVAGNSAGLYAYRLDDSTLTQVGHLSGVDFRPLRLVGDGQRIFVTDSAVLKVLTFDGSNFSEIVTFDPAYGFESIHVDGDMIFASADGWGVQALRLEGNAIVEVARADTPASARASWSDGTHLFVADQGSGGGLRAYAFEGGQGVSPVEIPSVAPPGVWTSGEGVLAGEAEPGASVEVRIDGSTVATATANGSGAWSASVSGLAEGDYRVTAVATVAGRDDSLPSPGVDLEVDPSLAEPIAGVDRIDRFKIQVQDDAGAAAILRIDVLP